MIEITTDPLPARDSTGNLAPIAQFRGNFTAWQAASHFAEMATPEPRTPRYPEGTWAADRSFHGTFRLVGGKRTYAMTYDPKYESWRVYMLPLKAKAKKGASHATD